MIYFLLLILSTPLSASTSCLQHDDTQYRDALVTTGDFLSIALPAVPVLLSINDYSSHKVSAQEAAQTVFTVAAMSASTINLKRLFRDTPLGRRPNGSYDSFPSGHTASAFCGALLIHQKFGLTYALPAYGLSALTAYSRVYGHFHHTRDVIAGAALALGVHFLVKEWGSNHSSAFSLQFNPLKKRVCFDLSF